jgi:signal transduction histidine kinase
MRGRRFRLGVRTRLLLTVAGAVSVALLIGVTAFNLLLDQRLTDSEIALAQGQATAEASALQVVDGQLVTPERPDEGVKIGSPVWVFAGKRPLETPRVAPSLDALARSLADGPERTVRVKEEIRLYALPVLHDGARVGTVVAGVPLEPYDETATIAFVGSIALAVLLLGAVTLLTRWILGKALLPVSRMTEDAATWSDHDLDQRFDRGEPYDELTQLAATLDALLERLSASIRHEQRFASELSHELRTPLARIAAEAELALHRERSSSDYRASLEAVHRNAEQMTRTVDALISVARQEAGLSRATSDARGAIQNAADSVHDDANAAGIEIRVSVPPAPVTVAIEHELLERIVQPLLDNAIRYGKRTVTVGLMRNGKAAIIEVVDDGAGVTMEERKHIFEAGSRGAAAAAAPGGAGLGLALARRLAQSVGGEIVAEPTQSGGRFTISLPLA